MKKSRIRSVSAVVMVLALAMSLAAFSCGDSDYRKAARAADGIAQGIHAGLQITKNLHEDGLMDDGEARAVAEALLHANEALDKFNAKAKALKQVDPGNKKLLALWFGEVAEAIAELNDKGVLRVKNPEARRQLAVALATIQGSAQILASVIGE